MKNFCRFFVGLLFIFSGYVKIVDPIGTSIKLDKYFQIFATNFHPVFEYLIPISLGIAVFVISLEIILGFALLFVYRMNITSWALLLLIGFFTILTFYTAITGEPSDCGCFGDALVISPWMSFSKDVVLTIMILVIFINRNDYFSRTNAPGGHIIMGILSGLTIWFAFRNINHLPFQDFRPYKVGNNIPEKMNDGKPGIVKTTYVLDKEGEQIEVADSVYMKDSKYWKAPYKYVDNKKDVIKEAESPSITDFGLSDKAGNDRTSEAFEGKVLFLVMRKAKPLDSELMAKLSSLEKEAKNAGYKVLVVSSMPPNDFQEVNSQMKLTSEVLGIDMDVSKAMIRADVGVITLQDGTVTGKWHYNDFPTIEEVKNP